MIKDIKTGYTVVNLVRIANTIIQKLGIKNDVYILPMKVMLDENAYVTSKGNISTIFIHPNILKKDALSDFNIKMLIHELTHVLQMQRGELIMDGANIRWKGKLFTKDTPHGERPFEIEARENERKYFKEIKQLLSL